ncbi:Tyrosine-protein phosphatase non-receptor type 1 [Taenia solium]|eukprot:TsM_000659400 transcript=TsM_000659400 gene=TsM_000659400
MSFPFSRPAPISIENFASKLQELNANNGFQALFQAIGTLTTSEFEGRYRLTKVAASQSGSRNRYCDMVPYDQSLVLVGRPWSTVMRDPQPQLTVGEVKEGYINASYVRRPEYGSGGEALVASMASLPEYIATQGPRENTVADFLTMVCQQRSPCIIMLCQCIESGKEKCLQYWPDDLTQTFQSENCNVVVRKESEESIGNVMRRQLKIHPSNEALPWTVTQFHFMGWSDYDIPNMESLYNLINMQNNFLETHSVGAEYGPTVVHCSAGVGRTGTFMAARFLLDRLRKNAQNVDIIGTVLAMRKWRRCLVQVPSQLQFLYNFVDFCLVRENLGVESIPPSAVASADYQNAVQRPQVAAVTKRTISD